MNLPQKERNVHNFRNKIGTLQDSSGQKISEAMLNLISRMLKEEQGERIGWEEISHHEVFTGFPQSGSEIGKLMDSEL